MSVNALDINIHQDLLLDTSRASRYIIKERALAVIEGNVKDQYKRMGLQAYAGEK